ncbi:MAG TPA: hemolysin family protein [Pyrinomonadaceae bacterium]|nr:hemolysin family protein [Pyrinomonadaceae bacterium]
MSAVVIEILFIALLLVANGVFAMSEIAVISARKARLQRLAAGGDRRARAALELAQEPDRFLSTVQIGITLVGILAGAFGGATIAEQLGVVLNRFPALDPYGEALGLAVVVLAITYLSLVVGELVPKRVGMNNPEGIARVVAGPMRTLSRLASPVVRLLSFSTSAVLRLLRTRPPEGPPVTEDEVRVMIEQATDAGVFEKAEREMVESVFRLGDRRVTALMTPRVDVAWLDVNLPSEEVARRISASHYSRMPVCDRHQDNVMGMVKAKDLLAAVLSGRQLDLRASLRQPLFVPETMTALRLLELFRQSRTHVALVVNEHGAFEGLVTLTDVLEAIVGDLVPPGGQAEPMAVRRDDGSWLLDGGITIDDFKEIFPVGRMPGEEDEDYQTLAGFVITYLGRIPSAADRFEWGGLTFEVVDMDARRVDKVLVTPAREEPEA